MKKIFAAILVLALALCACAFAEEAPAAMSYADYMAAEQESEVTIEAYVQATQSWWEDQITVYAADAVGGPYKAVTSVKATADGLKTLSIPAPSTKPARFVRIGVSDAQVPADTEPLLGFH